MTATHATLVATHALFLGAAIWMLVEAARLRRPLRRLLQRLTDGDEP